LDNKVFVTKDVEGPLLFFEVQRGPRAKTFGGTQL